MKRIVLALLALAMALPMAAEPLTILAEENPPFSFSDGGTATGLAVETLQAVMKKAGVAFALSDIQFQPWARAYESVQTKANTMLFAMARTPARENLFKWVGPIYHLNIGVVAKKSAKIKITDVAQFSKYMTGTVRDGAPEQTLISKGAKEEWLDRGASLDANIKKLMAGRVDLLAFNVPSALYNIAKNGGNAADYEMVYVLSEVDLYFAINKDTPDSVVMQLQNALDSLRKGGELAKLPAKYGL